jgi:flagellar basal-body rod protein FlgB
MPTVTSERVARHLQAFGCVSNLFSGISPLHYALDYHLERHNVLSSNVAHVDTPGYQPNDLARSDAVDFQNVLNVEMRRTNSLHAAAGADGGGVTAGTLFKDLSAGVGQDGNYVSLDREASKVAANQLRYDVVSAIVSAELRQLSFGASDAKG